VQVDQHRQPGGEEPPHGGGEVAVEGVPRRAVAYLPAPFDGPSYDLPEATIRNVAAAGFDFVRLTVASQRTGL
jgi:hypothetical protein